MSAKIKCPVCERWVAVAPKSRRIAPHGYRSLGVGVSHSGGCSAVGLTLEQASCCGEFMTGSDQHGDECARGAA